MEENIKKEPETMSEEISEQGLEHVSGGKGIATNVAFKYRYCWNCQNIYEVGKVKVCPACGKLLPTS